MRTIFLIVMIALALSGRSQGDRISDYNYLNWVQTINTISLGEKWSLHAEYQWRRDHGLRYWQQSLLRLGANYKCNDQVTAHLGYGWILTYPYGEYPLASAGTFPEHRIYEQLSLRQPVNKWLFTHRFRVEQRWIGKMRTGTDRGVESWTYLHRFRYQFRSQYPFWTNTNRQFYGALADEIFIGAGKNLGVNIFDQNRFFMLLGFKLNQKLSLEAGYFNQTVQQGKRINNQTIMQRNNGLVLTSLFNL